LVQYPGMDVRRLVAGLVALVVLTAGCVHRAGPADTGLRIMVPNPPGSGYDLMWPAGTAQWACTGSYTNGATTNSCC